MGSYRLKTITKRDDLRLKFAALISRKKTLTKLVEFFKSSGEKLEELSLDGSKKTGLCQKYALRSLCYKKKKNDNEFSSRIF